MLSTGTKLGPYEIVAPLGAGGMGEVYRARDTRLGREVAIKVLPESFLQDPERLRRFEQEARTVAALNHLNVLAVHDIGEYQGSPYMVCELLDGETLRDKMTGGAMGQRQALEYGSQMAEGLAAAHAKGIVHRDLKPENVFVTKDGRLKILDFGLAKLKPRMQMPVAAGEGMTAGGLTLTNPGMVLGTAGYMSPEQVRGEEVDARTDIFALGAILYEMVSGVRAFTGDTSVEMMNAILKDDPQDLQTEKVKVSLGLERVVRRCLEKAPAWRFQSACDVGFALEAVSGSSSTHPSVASKSRVPQTWRIWTAVAAMTTVFIAAFYAGLHTGTFRAAQPTSFRALTVKPQSIFRALFAGDGKTIVFASAPSGNSPDIYTLDPSDPGPRATGLRNVQLLSVASTGELAVLTNPQYLSHRVFLGTLAQVARDGSAPRELLEHACEADWTPDASALVVTHMAAGNFTLEFPIGHVLAQTSGWFSDPRFSPRGDKIAFFDHPLRYDDRGSVAVVDLAGNKEVLAGPFWGEEGLSWSRDGKEILFAAGSDYNTFTVRAVTLRGRSRIALVGPGGLMVHDVSHGGQWLITREDQRREMWGAGPDAKSETDLTFVDSSQPEAISGDGKTLLFTEDSGVFGSNYATFVRKMDGSPAVHLGEGKALDLSPDGTLALAEILSSPEKLVVYPRGAGQSWQVDIGALRNLDTAVWFHNGKQLLVCGSESGRLPRCYVVDARAGKPEPVTPEGTASGCRVDSNACVPSPDGNEVLARDGQGRYFVYPLAGGQPRKLSFLKPEDGILGWTHDGSGLIVRSSGWGPSVDIKRVDTHTGRRMLLRHLAPGEPGTLAVQAIAVGADGQSYAYAVKNQRSSLFLLDDLK